MNREEIIYSIATGKQTYPEYGRKTDGQLGTSSVFEIAQKVDNPVRWEDSTATEYVAHKSPKTHLTVSYNKHTNKLSPTATAKLVP